MKKIFLLPLLFALGCTHVTLVQSVPEGTDLAVPGLSFAKDEWVKKIDDSRETIDIEQMYLDGQPGHAVDPIIDALARANNRGVKIRLILSQQMIKTSEPTLAILAQKVPDLQKRVINLGDLTGGIQHAKFFIFDNKSVFVGSQNLDWKALTEILETGVTIDDAEIAAQLKSIFDLDWEIASTGKIPANLGTAPNRAEDSDVKLVACPPSLNPKNIRSGYDELVDLLRNAKTSVKITLLDLSTYRYNAPGEWLDLDKVLRETAARKVKIQILVSHWNTEKPEVNTIKNLSQVPNIEVKIATVPESSKGPIPFARVNHTKMMIVDDSILWVGTSNWSEDYFMHTRGIELVMKRPDLADQGNQIFSRLWSAPYTEAVDVSRDYPKPRK